MKDYGLLHGILTHHKESLATVTPYAFMNSEMTEDNIILKSDLDTYDLYSVGLDDDYVGGCGYYFGSYYKIENVNWDSAKGAYYRDEEHPYSYLPDHTGMTGVYGTYDESVCEGLGVRPMIKVCVSEQN